jgi:hypothetical protein
MIFFWAETPDGWGIPRIHGPLAEDELDGYVQSGVYLIRGKGENLLIDSGNWTLPEYNNGMGDFLVELLDREKNALKYIFVTMTMLATRLCSRSVTALPWCATRWIDRSLKIRCWSLAGRT